MGYLRNTIKGVSWIAALRIATRIITLLRTVLLARLLIPSQFGVFGIASLILAFFEVLTETGVNVFLIQQKKDIKEYIDSAWIVSIIRGAVLSLSIVLLAPFIASFFSSQESHGVILFIAIIPFIRGFINPAIITLQKDLQFHKEFWLRLSIFLLDSFIVVIFAFSTHSAASFVWGLLAGALFEVILSFLFIQPRPKLNFEQDKVKRIMGRGKWVTLSGIFTYIAQEGDNVAVGKILGTAPLGIYQVAYKFSTLPISEITDVVSKVVFPVYTKISHEPVRLFRAFIRTSLAISIGASLLGAIIFLFSETIISVLLGSNWTSAVPVIKILSIYGVLRAIFGSVSSLFLAVGKQEYIASMTFVRVLGLAITIVPLTLRYGLIGAGYAALFSVLIELPMIMLYTIKIFR